MDLRHPNLDLMSTVVLPGSSQQWQQCQVTHFFYWPQKLGTLCEECIGPSGPPDLVKVMATEMGRGMAAAAAH